MLTPEPNSSATAAPDTPAEDEAEDVAALPTAERCATHSRALGESMIGTASTVRRWLLLEQPGPWDSKTALASRRLPPGLGAQLSRRANEQRVRILLIRRHGRTTAGRSPACFVASSGPEASWLGELALDAPGDVLDVDLSRLGAGVVPGATSLDGPLFCVCTHGRHDPCCAERGRPVAAALAAAFPEQTWEVSHIGGDRFAGNVLCLPDGDYLGWVAPEDAPALAEAYLAGDYWLANLRGRSVLSPVAQAAEVLVRQRLGVTARHAVRLVAASQGDTAAVVRLDVAGHGLVTATLRLDPATPPRLLTCSALVAQQPPTYDLVDLRLP